MNKRPEQTPGIFGDVAVLLCARLNFFIIFGVFIAFLQLSGSRFLFFGLFFGVPAAVAGLFVFPKTGLFRIILPILLSLGSLRLFLTALSVFIISLPIFIIILLSLRLIVLPLLFLSLPAIVFRTALRLALLLVLLLLLILILLLLVLLFLLSF